MARAPGRRLPRHRACEARAQWKQKHKHDAALPALNPPSLARSPLSPSPVSNFSASDAGVLAGATAVSAPIGYLAGLKTRTARPALAMAAAIGAAAGFCLAYQRSAGRLMGFLPNDREVEAGLRR